MPTSKPSALLLLLVTPASALWRHYADHAHVRADGHITGSGFHLPPQASYGVLKFDAGLDGKAVPHSCLELCYEEPECHGRPWVHKC